MTPEAYCSDLVAKSGSSFYYSFLFLPEAKRQAMMIFYAFCREVDDIVDECTDMQIARTKLNWWRQEIIHVFDTTYQEKPQHPVAQGLQKIVSQYDLQAIHFAEIIDGMEMDLEQNRYVDFNGLALYCYRVASAVGLITAKILGYADPRTEQYAKDLGMAFQLTNIIRDVGVDVQKGRIYLPLEELKRFEVKPEEILNYQDSDRFRALMRFQAERAKEYYTKAHAMLPPGDLKNQKIGLVMSAIYRTLLDEIEEENFNVLRQKISLTPVRKLWLAWKTWLFN